jgi:hypothetical protein
MHLRSGYPLYCSEAVTRMYYYPSPYVTPMMKYDGLNGGSGYSGWRNMVTSRFPVNAAVTVTMWGTYTRGSGIINVQFRNDTTVTVTGRASIVITEDSLYYNGPNGDVWHNHVARDYVPTPTGTYVTIPPGDSVTVTQPFTIQTSWQEDMVEIVSWLQTDGTRYMWQGAKTALLNIGVREQEDEMVSVQKIYPAPNPCVNNTIFSFQLPTGTDYQIEIYDVTGRSIQTMTGKASGTTESVRWNCDNHAREKVSAGVYLYRFVSEGANTNGKIIVE